MSIKMASSMRLVRQRRFVSSFLSTPLEDAFNRPHNYLRISLTERCNLRCRYCMPKEGIKLSKSEDCLNLKELKRISGVFVKSCGITKVRLTGGEPTIFPELKQFLEHLDSLREFGLKTIAMTTNGLTLARHASTYKNLGLNNVNISLDTLKSDRFEQMTLRKGWKNVVNGLEAALGTGFEKVKLNCVVMRGINDDEIIDFANLAEKYPIEVRFIEFMPFAANNWSQNVLVPYKEIFEIVSRRYPKLERVKGNKNETSKVFRSAEQMLGSIGFITSMSENFCSGCNRIRLTADGNLKACLFGAGEVSLRDPIRAGASDTDIVDLLTDCLKKKSKQHAGAEFLRQNPTRPMIKIGG